MRVWTRSVLAAAAGLTLVGTAGCSSLGGAEEPPPAPKDELASVDPCKVLTPEELARYGIQGPGTPVADVPFQPACQYQGQDYDLSVYKDTQFNVEAIHKQGQWAKWDPVSLNGRPAAVTIDAGSTRARLCDTMFDSGKGRVSVQFGTHHPGDNSFCEKSQEIAKQIEPRMPKKQ